MDYTKEEHRLLVENPQAAQDFINSTRDNGGASIFLKDARLPAVGSENMFVVGKEPSQKQNNQYRLNTKTGELIIEI